MKYKTLFGGFFSEMGRGVFLGGADLEVLQTTA